MDSENEHFSRSGPSHLTKVDWNEKYHQRSVAASLVRGVYMLERDRQAGRCGYHQSRAHAWWEFFQFKLLRPLYDTDDSTVFGAIFEFNNNHAIFHKSRPSFVIAFRGTLRLPGTIVTDLKLDFDVVRNLLGRKTRFEIAMKEIRGILVSSKKIWLTGHSLGAAIAMLAGKTLAKEGILLDAFLFNPPYVSLPIETMIKSNKVRNGLRFLGDVAKVGLALLENDEYEDDSFVAISRWIPCLFVNQTDKFCCGYVGYFEHRKILEDMGAREIANLTGRFSLENKVMEAVGVKGVETSEPLHKLPSANLTVNHSRSGEYGDHDLCQWWRTNQNLRSTIYKYR